jgi:hypothetical protein
MVLNDLTSRDAVLAAIEEFDALGRDEFLKTYHFAQARDHFILHGGRRYDSKAIAGVAYGKQFPDRGPLEPGKFHGGDPVIRALERLGFDVRADADAALTSESKTETESRTSSDERSAWIFQANPALYDLQGALQKLTDLPWLVKQHRDAIKRGDTVYLWEGGADAGIVAIATVTGEPAMRRQNPEEADFNREPTKFAGDQLRVSLHIERVLQTRVRRIDLREHPVLKNMTILKAPQGTNFALSVDEFQALNSLIPRGTMALTIEDLQAMMAGFAKAGFWCIQKPTSPRNPIAVEWRTGQETRRYRLWAFDITHGGGGPTVRAADEFRIQITNGPETIADFDTGGVVDLLVGYSRDRDAIVAYDRHWLENWSRKKEETGSGGSPSVQVKEADIQAGHDNGRDRLYSLVSSAVRLDLAARRPPRRGHRSVSEAHVSARRDHPAAAQKPFCMPFQFRR